MLIIGFAAIIIIVVVLAIILEQVLFSSGQGNAGTPTTTITITKHHKKSSTPVIDLTPVATGMPYVLGTQIIDATGHPLILHGAQIESPFNYIKGWEAGQNPAKVLNPAVFQAMAQDWKMNALRLPLSNWIYGLNPATYLGRLDPIVQEANSAGLYVILDLHDDGQSGSPYGDNVNLPKAESVVFWKAIAVHYKDNPMIMFDVFNEPKATNWQTWLHGGGTQNGATIAGFQDLVDAIRSAGAKQIIVVEPGSAGGGSPKDAGWATIGNNTVNDPNIVYSLHVYSGIVDTPQQEDTKWGPILNHHPIYYGEWALLSNGYGQVGVAHCQNIPHAQADQIVDAFLSYMNSRHANWTAWEFTPYHLIQNYTSFTPTTLDMPWICGDVNSHAGMGVLVKLFLTGGA
jgi:aryl-phospho-beta-D-glucosidase BglC (GH1 family)